MPTRIVRQHSTKASLSAEKRLKKLEKAWAAVFKPDGTIVLNSSSKVEIVVGDSRITVDQSGIAVKSARKVTVDASMVTFDAEMTTTPGTIQCDTIIANNVIGSNYTPGAGNLM